MSISWKAKAMTHISACRRVNMSSSGVWTCFICNWNMTIIKTAAEFTNRYSELASVFTPKLI